MWVVGGPGGCCAGDSHRPDPALARLIGRCLGKDPARRPSDADALRELGSTSSASAAATRPASGGAGSASLLQIGARRGVAPGRLLTPLRGREPCRPAGAVGARSCPRRADRTGCRPKGDEMPVTSLSTCKECNRRSPQLGGEEDHRARTATRSVVNEAAVLSQVLLFSVGTGRMPNAYAVHRSRALPAVRFLAQDRACPQVLLETMRR